MIIVIGCATTSGVFVGHTTSFTPPILDEIQEMKDSIHLAILLKL